MVYNHIQGFVIFEIQLMWRLDSKGVFCGWNPQNTPTPAPRHAKSERSIILSSLMDQAFSYFLVSVFAEQNQFAGEVDHGMEQNNCQGAAICVVINPGEDNCQGHNAEEEQPEFQGANAQPAWQEPSMKNIGRCHTDQTTPRIKLETRALCFSCKRSST